jgi:hypothetical protein
MVRLVKQKLARGSDVVLTSIYLPAELMILPHRGYVLATDDPGEWYRRAMIRDFTKTMSQADAIADIIKYADCASIAAEIEVVCPIGTTLYSKYSDYVAGYSALLSAHVARGYEPITQADLIERLRAEAEKDPLC